MKANLLKSKYRLLVLFDHSKTANTALRTAVNLAKTIDAGIDIFHVKSPTQVVRYENQIAVMREIGEERSKARKKLRNLVNTISEEENIPVIHNFTFGNIVHEIQKHIDKTQPDVVVIGKRKAKVINFLGDGVTSHLMKNYKGGILISGNEEASISENNVSMGFLDDLVTKNNSNIAEELKKQTNESIKVFKINKSVKEVKKESAFSEHKEEVISSNTTIFEFDNGTDFSSNASNYIEKSKVSLLCVKKNMLLNMDNSLKVINGQIQKTINKTNIPVLILEN